MIPLEQIHIPTPCHESWDAMDGSERSRFCAGCCNHVHNLSEISRSEAQAVVDRAGEHVCVRFFPDADGRPLTRENWEVTATLAETPSFLTRGRRRLAAALSGLIAVALGGLNAGCGTVTLPPGLHTLVSRLSPTPSPTYPRMGLVRAVRPPPPPGTTVVMGAPLAVKPTKHTARHQTRSHRKSNHKGAAK